MSKQFYESLPSNVKSTLSPLPGDKIILANNQEIHSCGLAQIQATVNKANHNIDVYVIKETSHPLLLGVQYLKQHGIKLDFSSKTVQFTKCKIYTKKRMTLAPNSETIVWGRVPKNICTGFQGICSGSTYVNKKKLFVARSLGVVSTTSLVPIKILNPTSESVVQFIELSESYIYCIIILDFYHLKLLYIKLLTLFIQRKIYFILKEEKESSSLFDL